MTEIKGREQFFPRSKYGRSKDIESYKPNYLELAEEANAIFGKNLGDDTQLGKIFDHEGVVGSYINGLPDDIERKQKKYALRLYVGIARRIGLQTVGEVRKIGEKELQNLILEKLGNQTQYKQAPIYLKNIFNVGTSEN